MECEREDFEERFHKIQRKKQLQKVAARANLVVDDEDDDSDEEEKMYQQMDWIEKQSALTLSSYDSSSSSSSSSSDDDDSLSDDKDSTSALFAPRSKWKEERRRLLRISMAKIHSVEDPEAYLRRSVLINNTVRRLQSDVPINYRCHSVSTSYFQENVYQNESVSSWDASVVCRQETDSNTFTFDYQYDSQNDHADTMSYPVGYNDMPSSLNFHLACASLSSDKLTLEAIQRQVLQNGPVFYDRSSLEEQTLNDTSLSLVLKQQSPLHTFSSQPCGLQYRNPIHTEENRDEYGESSSSILDSVVYRSLIASLET